MVAMARQRLRGASTVDEPSDWRRLFENYVCIKQVRVHRLTAASEWKSNPIICDPRFEPTNTLNTITC
jgi:hypothetical protein